MTSTTTILLTVLFVIAASAVLLLAGAKMPGTFTPRTTLVLRRTATWTVGLAPIVACVGVTLLLFFLANGMLAGFGFFLTVLSILIGFFGGSALASSRRNLWWILVTFASAGIALVVVSAIAQLPPMNIY